MLEWVKKVPNERGDDRARPDAIAPKRSVKPRRSQEDIALFAKGRTGEASIFSEIDNSPT